MGNLKQKPKSDILDSNRDFCRSEVNPRASPGPIRRDLTIRKALRIYSKVNLSSYQKQLNVFGNWEPTDSDVIYHRTKMDENNIFLCHQGHEQNQ